MKAMLKILTIAVCGLFVITSYQIHYLSAQTEKQQKEIDALDIKIEESAQETAKLLAK